MMTLTVHLREPRSKRRRGQGYIAEHPNDEEEVEGIDLHQQRYPWEGSDMDYLYDELAPFDLTKKKKKTFVVQDAIEDSAESHERHTIRCLIIQEEFMSQEVKEEEAKHPNDEEEVEGIDLHQQRYPWEGSGMDVTHGREMTWITYTTSFNMPKSQCSGCCKMYMTAEFVAFDSEISKLAMCQDSKSISADD
ncbi:hypothetical protein DY000_02034773 [Brassica cretica]|uniref:Uncharacterized protein n=1 Tax=Brassica cretica TaxID=69181 RepID=A0ABQ7DIM2_BRACR|nr:hypothetical protein DY000_02034773 [Brassica cretica]